MLEGYNPPFLRMYDHDDASKEVRAARRERERQFKELLALKPTEEQLQPVGEPSLKAARVLGEAKLATKSAAGLAFFGDDGKFDAEAVRKANRELIEEKKRRLSRATQAVEASLGMPSQDQLDYPQAARSRPAPLKALRIFGDDSLAMQAKMNLPSLSSSASSNSSSHSEMVPSKAMRVFGSASAMAPAKARKVLGPDDFEARLLADKHWSEELAKRAEEFNRKVIARRPDETLMAIPMENGPLPSKALQFFGDEGLRRKSLRALKTRAPPKAIRVLGDPLLAGSKAAALTGMLSEEKDVPHARGIKRSNSPVAVIAPLLNYRKLFRFAVGEN